MGTAKDQMTAKTDEGKGIWSKLGVKSKKKETITQKAESVPDMMAALEKKLGELILVKESDLANESGKESANRKKVAILRSMMFHLEQMAEVGSEYDQVN
jgi:hypothetical protein